MPDSPSELPCPSSTFDPVRIEITLRGTLPDGQRYFAVDFVEADGGRSDIYGGTDHIEARAAAVFCADDGTRRATAGSCSRARSPLQPR